jgi:threonine/homoserine/homoserine lactone efflux protein
MISISAILLFLGASVAVTVAPGPDNIFVITQGITKGRKAALLTAWGMISGISVHTTAAALGISAVIYSSSIAFQILKFAGAAYLFYLAVVTFRARKRDIELGGDERTETSFEMYKRGLLMNILNPKVGLFFLAFLPQFVNPMAVNKSWVMIQLGLIFMAQAFCIFSIIAYFTGQIGILIKKYSSMRAMLSTAAAGTFAIIGLKIALEHR